MWDKRNWNCTEVQQGVYTLLCFLESTQENFRWAFTGVYGPHSNPEREDFWQELAAVRGLWDESWVVGGDFNVCRRESERLNCTRRSKAMKDFSEAIEDLGIIDLPLHGAIYTWARGENSDQASRIDKFLISQEWNESFKAVKQLALPNVISDHMPLLLESDLTLPTSSLRTCGFMLRVSLRMSKIGGIATQSMGALTSF